MTNIQVLMLGAMICAAIVVAAFVLRRNRPDSSAREHSTAVSGAETTRVTALPAKVEVEATHELLIGSDPSQPALRIAPLMDEQRFAKALPAQLQGSVAGRLNSVLQAAPALLTKNELSSGRKYMEVVINGDLVRSSTGEGYRAFSMGAKGIKENAVLLDPSRLTSIVNAGAVWQVASVIVAQKHLADISSKLDTITKGIDRIQASLSAARQGVIVGTHNYLRQATEAIRADELPEALRNQLETCERELLAAYEHLVAEFRARASEDVKHTETVGTEQLTADLKAKHKSLEALADEISLCLQTRVLAWYVWSVYPGEPSFKAARKSSIEEGIGELSKLNAMRNQALDTDLAKVKAFFNLGSTLYERKESIRQQSVITGMVLEQHHKASNDVLNRSANLLLKHDRSVSFVVALENGRLGEVRMLEVI
ncbi:hypothetical protein [Aquabacterium sp. A08]|uniref:hypothetical protein n=1 Tax=Aquabacterium sp. A08 TaxID=2718532 RepID=UPI001422B588|nr:hypothetical protein [Aquabacterium sp. A08]NIC42654.1 hypothetical protein [Aquabacterium sp. A08]